MRLLKQQTRSLQIFWTKQSVRITLSNKTSREASATFYVMPRPILGWQMARKEKLFASPSTTPQSKTDFHPHITDSERLEMRIEEHYGVCPIRDLRLAQTNLSSKLSNSAHPNRELTKQVTDHAIRVPHKSRTVHKDTQLLIIRSSPFQ